MCAHASMVDRRVELANDAFLLPRREAFGVALCPRTRVLVILRAGRRKDGDPFEPVVFGQLRQHLRFELPVVAALDDRNVRDAEERFE